MTPSNGEEEQAGKEGEMVWMGFWYVKRIARWARER
jgi:hypothetical protein